MSGLFGGIDMQYRMQRLSEKQTELLNEIVKTTMPIPTRKTATFESILTCVDGSIPSLPEGGSIITIKIPRPKWYRLIKLIKWMRNKEESWTVSGVEYNMDSGQLKIYVFQEKI